MLSNVAKARSFKRIPTEKSFLTFELKRTMSLPGDANSVRPAEGARKPMVAAAETVVLPILPILAGGGLLFHTNRIVRE